MNYTDADYIRVFPFVAWREPLSVRVVGQPDPFLGCRLCIARHGLRGSETSTTSPGKLCASRAEFDAHIAAQHPENS